MPHFAWHLADRELVIERPLVMGIVNVTPDSFSDGGKFFDSTAAIAHGLELASQGADILDVGGESTRPGAQPVQLDEELRRTVPVVRDLAARTKLPISIDTSKAEVARQCLEAGASIINDVSALLGDRTMADVARRTRAGVVLMHMQGTPATMHLDPQYNDVVEDIYRFLNSRLQGLTAFGLCPEQLAIDPGIGFGKSYDQSLRLIAELDRFQALGRPLCLGVSRKGFIGHVTGKPRLERMAGSLAVACHAMTRNAAQIIRVHDVAPTCDAIRMIQALRMNDRGASNTARDRSTAEDAGT